MAKSVLLHAHFFAGSGGGFGPFVHFDDHRLVGVERLAAGVAECLRVGVDDVAASRACDREPIALLEAARQIVGDNVGGR